jgi:hypothetical protein
VLVGEESVLGGVIPVDAQEFEAGMFRGALKNPLDKLLVVDPERCAAACVPSTASRNPASTKIALWVTGGTIVQAAFYPGLANPQVPRADGHGMRKPEGSDGFRVAFPAGQPRTTDNPPYRRRAPFTKTTATNS